MPEEKTKNKRSKPLNTKRTRQFNSRPKKVKDLATAKALLSHTIYQFQQGKVNESYSKTIAYLVGKYSELLKLEKLLGSERIFQVKTYCSARLTPMRGQLHIKELNQII